MRLEDRLKCPIQISVLFNRFIYLFIYYSFTHFIYKHESDEVHNDDHGITKGGNQRLLRNKTAESQPACSLNTFSSTLCHEFSLPIFDLQDISQIKGQESG